MLYTDIFKDIEIRDNSFTEYKVYFILCDLEKSLREEISQELSRAISWKLESFDNCIGRIRDKVKLIEYIYKTKEEFYRITHKE